MPAAFLPAAFFPSAYFAYAPTMYDRVKDTTTTTGTGPLTLANSAPTGFRTATSAYGTGTSTVNYCVELNSEWEVGQGSFNGTTFVLTRTTILASSNAGAAVNFSAGTKNFFVTAPAAKLITTDDAQTITGQKTITNPVITNYVETAYAPSSGTAFTVDLANGTLQKFTSSGNLTITLPTPAAGKSFTIQIAYGGAHTLTWAGGGTIKWAGGAAPTATSVNGKFDTFTFYSTGATNTFGVSGGSNA